MKKALGTELALLNAMLGEQNICPTRGEMPRTQIVRIPAGTPVQIIGQEKPRSFGNELVVRALLLDEAKGKKWSFELGQDECRVEFHLAQLDGPLSWRE